MNRIYFAVYVVVITCLHLTYAESENATLPIQKAAFFTDLPGTYYRAHSAFEFCDARVDIEAEDTVITSLLFDGTKATCGTAPIETKTYPGGDAGWANAMGERVQGKLGLTCGGTQVAIMITRAEIDYTSENPLWGFEEEGKFFHYKQGVKYLTFAQNNVGTCIYADQQLEDDGNFPGSSLITDVKECEKTNSCGLSPGAKAGIISGAVVLVVIISVVAFAFYIRKKKSQEDIVL